MSEADTISPDPRIGQRCELLVIQMVAKLARTTIPANRIQMIGRSGSCLLPVVQKRISKIDASEAWIIATSTAG